MKVNTELSALWYKGSIIALPFMLLIIVPYGIAWIYYKIKYKLGWKKRLQNEKEQLKREEERVHREALKYFEELQNKQRKDWERKERDKWL